MSQRDPTAPIVVISGCSSGIGLALCQVLQTRGYNVVATMRTPSKAPESLNGFDVQPLDVTCQKSAENLLAHVTARYGRCDILINNAAWGLPGTLETITIEDTKRIFEVNVYGVMRMCQLFVPLMRTVGGGLCLTLSGESGCRALVCTDAYVGSKWAIQGMMECFRYAVMKDNIKVCMAIPGTVKSSFGERFQSEGAAPMREGNLGISPRLVQFYNKKIYSWIQEGQPAEENVEAIADIVDREFPKKIDDGSQMGTFLNGTTDHSWHVVNNTNSHPDGFSGPIHAAVRKDLFESLAEMEKEC